MNYESITTCDIANGEGLGVVLWVSGCDVQCPGCHNKETWDPSSGREFDKKAVDLLSNELKREEISRFTISGGHPLMPCNRKIVREIIHWVKLNFDVKIWLYTGYYYDELDDECRYIADICDVVVDGPFIKELEDKSLAFRGSSNQNIIRND